MKRTNWSIIRQSRSPQNNITTPDLAVINSQIKKKPFLSITNYLVSLLVEKKLYEELFPKWPVEPHLTINFWHLGHECQNFYTSLLARPDHALSRTCSLSLSLSIRQYKRGLTNYNSGHMKMESNRLPEWLGLSTIWIYMYCTLIYKTTSHGNHNIKWHVWYTGKAIISDVNVKCKIPLLVNLKVWKILKWSFME